MTEAAHTTGEAAGLVRRHKLNRSDYYRMTEVGILPPDARVELIGGEIIDMAPIGSRHAAAVRRLAERFFGAIQGRGIVSVQSPIVLDETSEPEPDIALLRPQSDCYASAHPRPCDVLLLIEVADATLRYDREIKVPLYAAAGIPEVWIVDLAGGVVHVHALPDQGRYRENRELSRSAAISPQAFPDISIDLAEMFGD